MSQTINMSYTTNADKQNNVQLSQGIVTENHMKIANNKNTGIVNTKCNNDYAILIVSVSLMMPKLNFGRKNSMFITIR